MAKQRSWIKRVMGLLFTPYDEWTLIHSETTSSKQIAKRYLLSFSILLLIATLVGTYYDAPRDQYGFAYVFTSVCVQQGTFWGAIYLATFLLRGILYKSQPSKAFKLMAYTGTAFYLVQIVVSFFPFLSLLYLLGFYSLYILWCGIKNNLSHWITALCIWVGCHVLLYFLLHKILNALLIN